jgi:hypothetical protein
VKTTLLTIWYKLTGQRKILVEDRRLDKPIKTWVSVDEFDNFLEERDRMLAEERKLKNQGLDFVWSLVGNIVGEHAVGENKEIRKGTKHFSPGTKVYCFPPLWGDGYEKIQVIGRPRQSSRFIKVIIKSKLVRNWRMQKVYSSHIRLEMLANGGWDGTEESRKRIE